MSCSPLKVNRRFGETFHLCLQVEAIYSSEKSVDFTSTTRCYITEERTLHIHPCKNLSYKKVSRTFSFHICFTSLRIHQRFKSTFASIIKVYGVRQGRNQHEAGGDMDHEISLTFIRFTALYPKRQYYYKLVVALLTGPVQLRRCIEIHTSEAFVSSDYSNTVCFVPTCTWMTQTLIHLYQYSEHYKKWSPVSSTRTQLLYKNSFVYLYSCNNM
jgi:hypothetical protein